MSNTPFKLLEHSLRLSFKKEHKFYTFKMKAYFALALVACLVVASLAQESQSAPASLVGSPAAEYVSLPEEDTSGGNLNKSISCKGMVITLL